MGAEVEMVHVDEEGTARTAVAIAGAEHLPLHRRQGDVATAIAATANERDAIAVVLGARGLPAGASPAGHVTMELVQALDIRGGGRTAAGRAPPDRARARRGRGRR